MKKMRIGQAADKLNLSPITVRYYCNQGKLKYDLTPNGQRVFTQEYLNEFLGDSTEQILVFYCRDSGGDKANLESQNEKLAARYGEPIRVFEDGASGLNENRRGLWQLLKAAEKGQYNTLAITAKDRLTRFGYSYLEELLKVHGVKILVLDDTKEKSLYDELMSDFMSLIASFSGKFYKLRGLEQKRKLLAKAEDELNAS